MTDPTSEYRQSEKQPVLPFDGMESPSFALAKEGRSSRKRFPTRRHPVTPESFSSGTVPDAPAGCEVVEKAGCGSFSDVWKIRDLNTGRFYALKQLRSEWRNIPVAKQVLAVEAEVGTRVQGGYVVCVIDADPFDDRSSLIMEWLEGTTLEQLLRIETYLSESKAVWIARQCAQGLLELQRTGFSHGDLKPENIFLSPEGEVKLIDLGFAKSLENPEESPSGKFWTGPSGYLAPESFSSEKYNPVAKDIYSLGIILFRMVTGRFPFTAETEDGVLQMQKQSRSPGLRHFCPTATRQLNQLVNRMLANQPIRRPQQLRSLVRELLDVELLTLPERFAS